MGTLTSKDTTIKAPRPVGPRYAEQPTMDRSRFGGQPRVVIDCL